MAADYQQFLNECLLFDIEINERGRIYSIGASYQGQAFQIAPGKPVGEKQLREFAEFGASAAYLLGHNILSHDIPRLREVAPFLRLLDKPAVDTLYLSPLAFPKNPYHRLVKNYQIVRDSVSDPVQDALLAGQVFAEQWQAFGAELARGADTVLLYRGFLAGEPQLGGTAAALAAMGVPLLAGDELFELFSWLAAKHGCVRAVENIVDQLTDGVISTAPLAYVSAWLSVAGANSVLPPWVRHHFPTVPVLLHQLRESRCEETHCGYCREHHDPLQVLRDYYGFSAFRPEPATEEGLSLQEQIVRAAAANNTLFATLPTGGGKSLCYLLPGLMRYLQRNLLTIVISPLQALMKDQVDNFSRQTGTRLAAALYGLLTMPERGEVLETIRLGDIGILYVSPEQLRNRSFISTISQREIGAWVFDEAHCLSKWGHDFRPDYLYTIRFIREFARDEKTRIPPVQCFTATAKRDVKAEIIDIIQSELGLRVLQFAGGHQRTNLHYEVWPVERYEKFQTILELLRARYTSGSVVIYCAGRKATETLAEFLQGAGYAAEAFHAGLEPSLKKRIQENFIEGVTPVICATNAFGMGIDKENVRLVIHADIPGSLENYLQEAGRAGRDRHEAECILIFAEQDIENQFRLSSMSRLSQREIAQILRGIRFAARGGEEVVVTAGELLRMEEVDIDPEGVSDGDTRVRTAVSWLERAGYLERNVNETRVFQGKPLVRDLEEAAKKIDQLGLSQRQRKRWLAILSVFMAKTTNEGFSADELASLPEFALGDDESGSDTERVLRTLHDMAAQGLLTKETLLTAYIRYKVQKSSEKHLQQVLALERDFLRVLEEAAPDADLENPLELDLRQVNQQLLDKGYNYSTPHTLKLILHGLSRDGKGLAGQKGSVSLSPRGSNRFTFRLNRDWESLAKTVQVRQQAATVALQAILAGVDRETRANASLLAEFTLEGIVAGLKSDLLLLPLLKDPLAAAERALTFMHEQGVIDLQQGLAVFRQAMSIRLNPVARSRRYSKDDFSPLDTHYSERNFQIHVMNEYARKAIEKLSAAMSLVSSYFNDDKDDFIRRFFAGRTRMLKRATSEQSYSRLVDDLKNDSQEKIVAGPVERNMLVLAGPGSGKTRVVAHRVAYLLRVRRVNPRAVLVLCFNRGAVMSLRRRLRELVGNEMAAVTTLTFHGLALRLTGRSLVTSAPVRGGEEIDFSRIIDDAVKLLKGEVDVLGLGDMPARDMLIGRFSHILVDEYQDIDGEQYELVSLLAGRSLAEQERRLTILAVGDDDQNIYRFRGASVGFIRRFHDDYQAEIHYLVENYRSTAHIIAAANALIAHNTDRMKTGQPIRVNSARAELPAGGNWQIGDPLSQGRVQRLLVDGPRQQAQAVIAEIGRLQMLGGAFAPGGCAVLAREWKDLDPVRSALESAGLPVDLSWGRRDGFPRLTKIRENAILMEYLRENRSQTLPASALIAFVSQTEAAGAVWQSNLRRLLLEWQEETGDSPQPVPAIEEYLYEALADQGRSGNLAEGIFLSTIHSVKGLEFDHVFMLADSWQTKSGPEAEEERRLYYVGMSRARQTLHLFCQADRPHSHASLLGGDYLLERTVKAEGGMGQVHRRYQFLGLKDMYIDYAGRKGETHPVRQALAGLAAGDILAAELRNGQIELVNDAGLSVARLAQSARTTWENRLHQVVEVRVVAMVRRFRQDLTDREFAAGCYGEVWEVPVVELVWQETAPPARACP